MLKSTEIEGEILDREQAQSSIARRLGMNVAGIVPADRNVDGIVEMILDATQNYAQELTEDRLFDRHVSLFPTGRSGTHKIIAANCRKGLIQVVSGAMGKEKVHYEAPESDLLKMEMKLFLDWFNSNNALDGVLKSAIAHLWFVTIRLFDDGNGHIARAIADM